MLGICFRVPQAGMRLQQCRYARTSLNEGVVHLPRQPVPLFQYGAKPGPQLTQTELVCAKNTRSQQKHTTAHEPPGPVEVWLLNNFQGCLRDLLRIVHLKGCNTKLVLPGREIGVVSHSAQR